MRTAPKPRAKTPSRELLLSERYEIAHLYGCQWVQGLSDDDLPIISLIDRATSKEVYIGTMNEVCSIDIDKWVARCKQVSGQQRPVFGRSA